MELKILYSEKINKEWLNFVLFPEILPKVVSYIYLPLIFKTKLYIYIYVDK